jgi:hypothetical protein
MLHWWLVRVENHVGAILVLHWWIVVLQSFTWLRRYIGIASLLHDRWIVLLCIKCYVDIHSRLSCCLATGRVAPLMTELMPSLGITVVFPLNRSWNVVIQNLESFEIYIIYSMGAAACSSSSKKKDVFSINNLPYKFLLILT